MRGLAILLFMSPWLLGATRANTSPCWVDKGAVVVSASFGDIAGDFLLDPSTPKSLLHLTRAQNDGIVDASARRTLVLAGATLPWVDMAVVDLDDRTREFDTTINGVIGADVLGGFVVDLSFAPCRLTLLHSPRRRMPGSVRLPVRFVGGVPSVTAAVSDGDQTRRGQFAIDTSRRETLVSNAALSRAPPEGGGPPIQLRAISLGGRLFEETPANLSKAASQGLAGSIGTAVLSQWRLRLDLAQGWLEIAPTETFRPSGRRLSRRNDSSRREDR